MKTLLGSEKQVKWAESLRAEYLRLVKKFGGVEIDCEDAKFWIEHAQVNNITYKNVPAKLEAYEFLKSIGEKRIDATDMRAWDAYDNGLLSEEAINIIYGA